MKTKHIIFVPGKNPIPEESIYSNQLWRTLVEGVRRADELVADTLQDKRELFHLINWNDIYYHSQMDFSRDILWIDALLNKRGPTDQDILDAHSWNIIFSRLILMMGDDIPLLFRFLPTEVQRAVTEISRYFDNTDNVACKVRGLLKSYIRPMLEHQDNVLLIGHSLGSAIAYDTLWELSYEDGVKGKVDFLTLGSPLGMHYIKSRLLGMNDERKSDYPDQIRYWINLSAEGDVVALNKNLKECFHQMIDLGLVEAIEDYHHGIYNFFRSDSGLDCHRAYGYMVNPYVGNIIADWWKRH